MPLIAIFCGIIIRMYFQQSERNPPHFHAIYGSEAAAIEIATLQIMDGFLPPKEARLVHEWALIHKDELMEMWQTQNFYKLPPL